MPAATYFIPTPTRTPPSTPTTSTFSMPTTPTPNQDLPSKSTLAYRLEHAALWARLHGLTDDTDRVHDDASQNERDRKWAVALCSLAEVAYLVTPDVVRDTLLPFAQSEEEAVGIQFVVDALCAPVYGAGGWI